MTDEQCVEFATVKEVLLALDLLTDGDYQRLHRVAGRAAAGTEYGDAQELVAAAAATAHRAAAGLGGRRWARRKGDKEVDFRAYLAMTIRGMGSDARRRQRAHPVCNGFFGPEPQAEEGELALPSPESECAQEEEERRAEAHCHTLHAKVISLFRDNPHVMWVIRGIKEDLPKRDVVARSGMTPTQYESAYKRLKRVRGLLLTGT